MQRGALSALTQLQLNTDLSFIWNLQTKLQGRSADTEAGLRMIVMAYMATTLFTDTVAVYTSVAYLLSRVGGGAASGRRSVGLTQRGRGEHLFWIHTQSPDPTT